MKRQTIYLLLLLLPLLLACKESKRWHIGVAQPSIDEWREQMNHEMEREALLHDDVRLTILSSKDSSKKQIRNIRRLMDEGIDLLIVSPTERDSLTPIMEEVYKRGIPVVVFDRKTASPKYTAFIGADNRKIGSLVAHHIAGDKSRKGKSVLLLQGNRGSTAEVERTGGFMREAQRLGLHVADSLDCRFRQHEAFTLTQAWLREHKGETLDYIFAENDRMGLGAYMALKAAGRAQETSIVGVDGLASDPLKNKETITSTKEMPVAGVKLVKKGILSTTITYPTAGDKVLRLGLDILEKRPYKRENTLASVPVDDTTAEVLLLQTREVQALDEQIGKLNDRFLDYLSLSRLYRSSFIATLLVIAIVLVLLVVVWRSYWQKRTLTEQLSSERLNLREKVDELEQMQRQLEAATTSKLQFFTSVSHDFRTPLTLIIDPINTLFQEAKDTKQKRLLELVRRNVAILHRLVNQILDFRKYENSRLAVSKDTFDLKASLLAWCRGFEGLAKTRGFGFSVKADRETDFRVVLDEEKTERIVFNLLANAFKYTPKGGDIEVRLTMEGGFITILISDNGQGISPEALPHIFERMYQVDNQAQGSGLGLALVKAFCNVQGGSISAKSEVGKGSSFRVKLPYVKAGDEKAETRQLISQEEINTELGDSPRPQESLKEEREEDIQAFMEQDMKPTLLVVDDNADIRSYIRQTMQGEYTVFTAKNGEEGLRKAVERVPDVIVSDVMMPQMDGIEMLHRLKNTVETSHIPVVMLTACALDEKRVEGYEEGAESYLAKPFSHDVLSSRLKNLINGRRKLVEIILKDVYSGKGVSQGCSAQISNRTAVEQPSGCSAPNGNQAQTPMRSPVEQPSGCSVPNGNQAQTPMRSPVEQPSGCSVPNGNTAMGNQGQMQTQFPTQKSKKREELFMERFREVLLKNISNADASVDDLAKEMLLSRVQLYRKVKALSNLSPTDLLRQMRLTEAARLIKEGDKTIQEITYDVGFTTPSYFSKCFKEKYGCAPSEYC